MKSTIKTSKEGHRFYKSSDCPTCPVCEAERKPKDGFLSKLSAPARRAMERENINTLEDLSQRCERDILGLHGIGPSAIPVLHAALLDRGLSFKEHT